MKYWNKYKYYQMTVTIYFNNSKKLYIEYTKK